MIHGRLLGYIYFVGKELSFLTHPFSVLLWVRLIHWDVMNELVHGQWFEEKFNDPQFTQRMFDQVKALDPHPTLMLNDFHVVAESDCTDVSEWWCLFVCLFVFVCFLF